MDKIIIHERLPDGMCSVCEKRMRTRVLRKSPDYDGLKEIVVKTSHAGCSRLDSKRRNLIQRLLQTEFDIFLLKSQ